MIHSKTKAARMLREFLNAGRVGLNKFEAFDLGDTAISQTVQSFENRYGLSFDKRFEKLLNRYGGKTAFMRYSIDVESVSRAEQLLESLL